LESSRMICPIDIAGYVLTEDVFNCFIYILCYWQYKSRYATRRGFAYR